MINFIYLFIWKYLDGRIPLDVEAPRRALVGRGVERAELDLPCDTCERARRRWGLMRCRWCVRVCMHFPPPPHTDRAYTPLPSHAYKLTLEPLGRLLPLRLQLLAVPAVVRSD